MMSRQGDEPFKPPHRRKSMMDNESDLDNDETTYKPDSDDDGDEDERSRIGRFIGRGQHSLTQAGPQDSSRMNPSAPIRKNTANRPPPPNMKVHASLYAGLMQSSVNPVKSGQSAEKKR
ncbi:hypothetical protein BS17DRAFT_777721, partial [Gyrodon lividus]